MSTARRRKSWTDLTRRPARAIFTTLTLALAVASFGILAVPTLMHRAMSSEVSASRLYDVFVPVDDVVLSSEQLARLARLPNVAAVSARSLYSTRALIGTRRVDTELWGVADFAHQPVDLVVTKHAPGPDQVLVDGQDATLGITNARAGDTLRLQAADGSYRTLQVAGSARGIAFYQDTLTGRLVLYADQDLVRRLGGFRGVNLLELRLHDPRQPAANATIARVRAFLAQQPQPTTFAALPTIRAPGDWPLKAVFDQRAKVLDILIALAVLSALFLIANTMRTLVAEQRREIGVMRAIGASRGDLRDIYLRTAGLLGLFGAAAGAVLGMWLAHLLVVLFAKRIFGITPAFAVDWPVVAVAAVAGVAGAVLTAWPTLRRALREPVHEALTSEGLTSGFGASAVDRALLRSVPLPTSTRIGIRNAARQKGRNATTVAQVALAVATFLGLLSLALAVSEVTDQSWNVLHFDLTLSAQPGGHLYDTAVVDDIGSQPGVAGVEPADWVLMSYRGHTLFGLGVHARTFVQEPIARGRWFTPAEEQERARVAVIGSGVARRWHLHPGSKVTLTTPTGPATFRVVGVGASDANNGDNVYTSLGVLQDLTAHPGVANSMLIRATDTSHRAIDLLAARLEGHLAASGYASRSQIMYAGRATDKANASTLLVIVEGVGMLIVAISMLGLVNSITMNIIERTREIGVLRCVGARSRDVRRIFRTETVTLAVVGFVVGIPLGWVVAHALQQLVLRLVGAALPAPYPLRALVLALVGTVVLALLVVALPLARATRLRPGDAIRYS